MSKLTISECSKLIDKSQPTIYRAIKSGKISCSENQDGQKVIDIAELQRVYNVKTLQNGSPNENGVYSEQHTETQTDNQNGNHETQKLIATLEEQVEQLKEQLQTKDEQLKGANAEKMKLLEVTDKLQLMLPPPQKSKVKRSFWSYLRLKR